MVSSSIRHLHHKHAREADGGDDQQQRPRAALGVAGGPTRARRHRPSDARSTVLDDISDDRTELARFLFVGGEEEKEVWDENGRREGSSGGDGDASDGLATMQAWAYYVHLLPREVQSERTIMYAEAYALFGALFMNTSWILYEWGSPRNGYGGEGTSIAAERAFNFIVALAFSGNATLTVTASTLWLFSIVYSCTDKEWAVKCRKSLACCKILFLVTIEFTACSLFLGVYLNLSPYLPETIAALCVGIPLFLMAFRANCEALTALAPLELYHSPWWFRFLIYPSVTHKGREELRSRAKRKADQMRKRAYRERKVVDPGSLTGPRSGTSIGILLRRAAVNLGRLDDDMSSYEAALGDDWYDHPDQMKKMSVGDLKQYMPRRLAEEVHRLVHENEL
ncbi:hypothetical protein ACHAXT_013317 [Thalassiosira profunda]